MDELIIRRMEQRDVSHVSALEQAVFPSMPWQEYMFRSELQNMVARYLVAEENGRVIGYAGAHIILDEGHVTNIAVAPDARGKGVGRGLARALLQYASNLGVSYMTLEVRQSNLIAQSLYRSLGFHPVTLRKGYYEDNREDALLMVCDKLPPADPDFTEPETLLLED